METDGLIKRVTLDLLEVFVAVAEQGTISAAARKLNIDPSLATRKIAALESALGSRLLDRTTRRAYLTEAGQLVLRWSTETVRGHRDLVDELQVMQGRPAGLIRLVLNEYVCTFLMPAFLESFATRYPEVHFDISVTDNLVTPEETGYDVAVHSGFVPDSGLRGVRVADVNRILCASPTYLKGRGMPQRLSDLESHDCLAHQQAAGGCWNFRRWDDTSVIRQPIHQKLVANSYIPLIKFGVSGLGIIRVSLNSVKDELSTGQLVRLFPEYECINADGSLAAIWILYPSNRRLERTRIFVSELSSYLKSVPRS
jgi:DNA-binding transcriptional LysR family regulator